MLLLALMSSENSAASAAHHYPGGYKAFIKAMNAKAKSLEMNNTRFVEPTGLSVHNVSTARDFMPKFRGSLFSLALMLACSAFCTAGRCENGSRYHRVNNRKFASGSAMIAGSGIPTK